MCEQDLALDNLPGLICHKTRRNKTNLQVYLLIYIYIIYIYIYIYIHIYIYIFRQLDF